MFPKGAIAEIHPFNYEPGYTIGISILVDNAFEKSIDVDGVLTDHYVITWRMHWVENKPVAYAGLIVAYADGVEFTLNTVFALIGTAERYFVDFRYNIIKKAVK